MWRIYCQHKIFHQYDFIIPDDPNPDIQNMEVLFMHIYQSENVIWISVYSCLFFKAQMSYTIVHLFLKKYFSHWLNLYQETQDLRVVKRTLIFKDSNICSHIFYDWHVVIPEEKTLNNFFSTNYITLIACERIRHSEHTKQSCTCIAKSVSKGIRRYQKSRQKS